MGQVYLGVSPGGRKVAVKLIHPDLAGTAQFRERFAREIDAARKVGGFHTAPVVDADPRADPPWMVTAFIDGPSLQEAIGRNGPLPPHVVRVLGAGLAEGLAAIHAHGLVHRDLKPGNVILAADGPRIIDFGIARAVDATTGITSTGAVIGTFAYMSPEQIGGDTAGTPSDVFSLGCVLAFAATGRPPFGADSAATVMFRIVGQPPDLAGLADDELRELIAGCLAKAPADRPSVPAFLAMLTGSGPVSANPRSPRLAAPEATGRDLETQTHPAQRAPAPVTVAPVPPSGLARATKPLHARPSRRRTRRLTVALIGIAAIVALAATLPFLLTAKKPPASPHRTPQLASSHRALPGHIVFLSSSVRALKTAHQFWYMHEISPDGAGSRLLPIGDALCCSSPALSPDGTKLTFTGEGMMTVTDLQGHLANGAWNNYLVSPLQTPTGAFEDPTWSPSGRQIAFLYFPGNGKTPEIDVINADGTGRRTVLRDHEINDQPGAFLAWSPGGTQLAFGTIPARKGSHAGAIAVVAMSSGPAHVLVTGIPGGVTGLSWAPGPHLLFTSGNERGIWEADGQGHARVILQCAVCQFTYPSWAPDGVHFAAVRSGKGVIVASVARGVQATIGPADVTYVQWGGPTALP